jgi:hypothetical protein
LLGAGNEAVLSAGKDIPVGVRIRCLLDCVRNAKQCLGLALIGAARQKQCQTDNGKVSFPASQKSEQNKVSHVCAIVTPSPNPGTSHRMDDSYCVCNFLRLVGGDCELNGRAGWAIRPGRKRPESNHSQNEQENYEKASSEGHFLINSMATRKSPEPSLVVEIMWGRFWPLCWPSLKGVICFSA